MALRIILIDHPRYAHRDVWSLAIHQSWPPLPPSLITSTEGKGREKKQERPGHGSFLFLCLFLFPRFLHPRNPPPKLRKKKANQRERFPGIAFPIGKFVGISAQMLGEELLHAKPRRDRWGGVSSCFPPRRASNIRKEKRQTHLRASDI